MPYRLLYHPQIREEDLPPLPRAIQRRIARAIESRLAVAPERCGEPLRGTLKGYWKLRVGDYRIVFKLSGTEVWILGIMHRRFVYEDVIRHVEWPPTRRTDH